MEEGVGDSITGLRIMEEWSASSLSSSCSKCFCFFKFIQSLRAQDSNFCLTSCIALRLSCNSIEKSKYNTDAIMHSVLHVPNETEGLPVSERGGNNLASSLLLFLRPVMCQLVNETETHQGSKERKRMAIYNLMFPLQKRLARCWSNPMADFPRN